MYLNPIVNFIAIIANGALWIMTWSIILSAISSWLVAFNILNPRNAFVYQVLRFLDAITSPILAPFRRVIPLMGGVDISPVAALLVIEGLQQALLPWVLHLLDASLGGGGV